MSTTPDQIDEIADPRQAYLIGTQIGEMREQTRTHAQRLDRMESRMDHLEEHLSRQDLLFDTHFTKLDASVERTAQSIAALTTLVADQNQRDEEMRAFYTEAREEANAEHERRARAEAAHARAAARRANISYSVALTVGGSALASSFNLALHLPIREALLVLGSTIGLVTLVIALIFWRSRHDANIDTKLGVH